MSIVSVTHGWWGDRASAWFESTLIELRVYEAMMYGTEPNNALADAGMYARFGHAAALTQPGGWESPLVAEFYGKALARRKPDGGFGAAWDFDAFQDGTVNPWLTTTYAISTAYNVGLHLIPALDNGVIGLADVLPTVDCVLSWPVANGFPDYSKATADHGKPGVYNTTAALAAFLLYIRSRLDTGRAESALNLGRAWKDKVNAAYSPTLKGWPYQVGVTTRQDTAHNAVAAEVLVPWIGTAAATDMLGTGKVAADADYNAFLYGIINVLYLPATAPWVDRYAWEIAGMFDAAPPGPDKIRHALAAARIQAQSYV